MTRSTITLALLMCVAASTTRAQRLDARRTTNDARARYAPTDFWRREAPHYGKWLTAAGTVALTLLGAEQHRYSRRDWNALLEICRSAQDACVLGPNGRYLRSDAELLYQRSRAFDRRANRWLLGAQASLLATTALFIIDLHPGEGPENIPFPGNKIDVGMRLRF